MINIGHDEAYSISICPKCRKTPAPVTYANDVKKIHAFLKERGIKTLMWGEKLLNARLAGKPVGGAGHGKGLGKVHALFRCRDLLPRDITMLNWYYGINPDYDKIYHERGFKMLFGNLNALNAKNWDKRIEAGAKGGFVSNWGSFREEYMQRNLQYFALTITAYAFWCEDYEANGNEKNVLRTAKELYRLKCKNIKNKLTVTHTCDYEIAFKFFYDGEFIIDEDYTLGSYLLTYSDGQTETLPVKYGTNIGRYEYENYANNASFRSTLYSTLPKKISDGFAYEAVYEDPRPDAELVSIVYQPKEKMKNVKVNLLAFSRSKAARGDRAESILNDNVSKDELIFA
jgi:hexosaminidase